MTDTLNMTIEPPDDAVNAYIMTGLAAFNRAEANRPERQHFNVVLRDGEGRVQGGVMASVGFDVLRIEELFIDETHRRGGHGSRLLAIAEDEARRRGARLSCVMTFSWQARPFYEKQGYEVFAELPYQNGTHALYWLRKSLCA